MKTGKGLTEYALSKIGTPYFYGSKMTKLTESFMAQMHNLYPSTVTNGYIQKARNKGMVGRVCVDCSGLIYAYTGRNLGSAQLYAQAYARLSAKDYKSWADGVVVWRKGHVGIFFQENGKYYVIEAKGIDYGTVISQFKPSSWSYGLTFSWMDYVIDESVPTEWKKQNPYKEPVGLVRLGNKGTSVKWVQWELVESGYSISIDGDFGQKTLSAVKDFQKSCKITVDGIVGNVTREFLKTK